MAESNLIPAAACARTDLECFVPPPSAQTLYVREGHEFREVAEQDVLACAQALVTQRFHRGFPVLADPQAVRMFLQLHLAPLKSIRVSALFLNRRRRLLAYHEMFKGTFDICIVHPREVVRDALRHEAAGVILVRNEPDGEILFSQYDAHVWKRVRAALALVEIEALDFFLVGKQVVSCVEAGFIETRQQREVDRHLVFGCPLGTYAAEPARALNLRKNSTVSS